MDNKPLTKAQLKAEIRRFIADLDRGISVKLFAELCGINKEHLLDVFYFRVHPLTEYIQIRVSKGYKAWKNGEVAVMQRQDKTRYVEYRRNAAPRVVNSTGLQVVNGAIKIRLGVRNLGDYSVPDLNEQLKRG